MKIRKGFVSNSSSSSFIITQNGRYTPRNVKTKLVQILKQLQKSKIKNIRREVALDKSCVNSDMMVKFLRDYYNKNTYSDKEVNEYLKVKYIKEERKNGYIDLNYWYAGKNLSDDNIIIFDTRDNYIPDYAVKKILKEFNISSECYRLHM